MFPTYSEVMSTISQGVKELEQERVVAVSSIKMHGLFLLSGILIIIIFWVLEAALGMMLTILWIIYIIIAFILINKKYRKHRLNFKDKVVWSMSHHMLVLCKLPNETDRYRYECSYEHKQRLPDRYIQNSRLFDYSIDKIEGEDLFSGTIGRTDFKFSELTLSQIHVSTNSKGQTTRREVTMFDGVLFAADFHKEFDGVTLLKSANIFNNGTIAAWLQPIKNIFSFLSIEKKQSINLENEDFNRAFSVQTTDEIKARYILSSSMMERLLKFKNKHREKVEVSFVHSCMYIALSTGRNYFEPKLFQPIADQQTQVVYDDLTFFFGMVEDFDLNTRIWNKN